METGGGGTAGETGGGAETGLTTTLLEVVWVEEGAGERLGAEERGGRGAEDPGEERETEISGEAGIRTGVERGGRGVVGD